MKKEGKFDERQSENFSDILEYIFDITHELSNPLTSIMGFSEILLDEAESDFSKEYLTKIINETRHCAEILEKLRTFSKKNNQNSL